MSKIVGVRLPDQLYNLVQMYKEEKGHIHDSEAVRDIIRRFLTEVWQPSRSSRHSSGREVREEKGGVED
ncbi:ribbon-helix-helix domain-containing protein [Archaeoglobus profundus]|uniref:Ribbon-helix-helix protein CopG domain-containing protein n=1 Tax=Archaeoglobus profundus (strain DSM 5631 / JCM 9629 / NBRC 100127 / Av18) TaxID=572546 RepID=D2RI49_ARCPA|nr:hypothetical protein [Archaeoglobus profundus]ADB57974.1 hypothetical protein Arcpr_0913 [Archaeoglobus profundus DSM 5631]